MLTHAQAREAARIAKPKGRRRPTSKAERKKYLGRIR